jgi:hypothetical protein
VFVLSGSFEPEDAHVGIAGIFLGGNSFEFVGDFTGYTEGGAVFVDVDGPDLLAGDIAATTQMRQQARGGGSVAGAPIGLERYETVGAPRLLRMIRTWRARRTIWTIRATGTTAAIRMAIVGCTSCAHDRGIELEWLTRQLRRGHGEQCRD